MRNANLFLFHANKSIMCQLWKILLVPVHIKKITFIIVLLFRKTTLTFWYVSALFSLCIRLIHLDYTVCTILDYIINIFPHIIYILGNNFKSLRNTPNKCIYSNLCDSPMVGYLCCFWYLGDYK